MLINYVPGEECRVAVVTDNQLEELHAERLNAVSHVGNIYVGKVVNVEPAIQAAFVDFGLEHNGFLHISDLHPQYFPGEGGSATEQVGKKTPRRSRPPIQEALRRGQEVIVQVLKEGIGTKGPTLTSYLSIPGRYLVMMPNMDRVGVSRKVEDEEQRRAMRDILDQLELPDGFGFILRTAGMDRTKVELKRDLAYLMRLWKDMDRRRRTGGKPRLLYAESDLLVRALRDVLNSDFNEVVIDDPSALARASRFMKIVAPRTSTKLLKYDAATPIFHAYGVEEQIKRIYSREVPLPSGGSLVIDETEALVAIDVNSGRMRGHGDAETTAYRTNIEAVEEICRQLRLRDLGGLVIHDLIDMRSRAHQRDIEQRFRNALKKDRARSKILTISQFGIVEMTRQRMRGSARSMQFAPCPECSGRGLVQRPDSVANDAMRELANVLQHDRVAKVEMVVSPRVAGELLSTKRQRLGRMERSTHKHVDVRVSETIPVDRVVFYAYDDRAADIEIDKLPRSRPPENLLEWSDGSIEVDDWAVDPLVEADSAPELGEGEAPEGASEFEKDLYLTDLDEDTIEPLAPGEDGGPRKKRRRRRRGGRRDREGAPEGQPDGQRQPEPVGAPAPYENGEAASTSDESGDGQKKGRRRRRRRRRGGSGVEGAMGDQQQQQQPSQEFGQQESFADSEYEGDARDDRDGDRDSRDGYEAPAGGPAREGEESADGEPRKRRRRRRRRKGQGRDGETAGAGEQRQEPDYSERFTEEGEAEQFVENGDASHLPRGDSWDLEPSTVTPAVKPARPEPARAPKEARREEVVQPRAASAAKAAAARDERERDRGGDAGDDDTLSSDALMDMDGDDESIAAPVGASGAPGARGDSWDLEPAAVVPSTRRQPSPRAPVQAAVAEAVVDADAEVDADSDGDEGVAAPDIKKKKRRRSKRGGAAAKAGGEKSAPVAEAKPAPKKPAAKKTSARKRSSKKASSRKPASGGGSGGGDAE